MGGSSGFTLVPAGLFSFSLFEKVNRILSVELCTGSRSMNFSAVKPLLSFYSRVISWIDFVWREKMIHEITRIIE